MLFVLLLFEEVELVVGQCRVLLPKVAELRSLVEDAALADFVEADRCAEAIIYRYAFLAEQFWLFVLKQCCGLAPHTRPHTLHRLHMIPFVFRM